MRAEEVEAMSSATTGTVGLVIVGPGRLITRVRSVISLVSQCSVTSFFLTPMPLQCCLTGNQRESVGREDVMSRVCKVWRSRCESGSVEQIKPSPDLKFSARRQWEWRHDDRPCSKPICTGRSGSPAR